MSNALDLERRALENELMRIQILKEKIDTIAKLSDFATKGIMQTDDLQIYLNEISYLWKKNAKIGTSGKSIDSIT